MMNFIESRGLGRQQQFVFILGFVFSLSMTIWISHHDSRVVWAQGKKTRPQTSQSRAETPTPAMEAEATKRINRLSDQLKSPFCPGKTLLTCTSPEAFKLRREMRQMILEGYDDHDILKVVSKSFDEPLENPPQPWITVLVPVIPFIFGLMIALWMFMHWRKSSGPELSNDDSLAEGDAEKKYYDRLQDLLNDED